MRLGSMMSAGILACALLLAAAQAEAKGLAKSKGRYFTGHGLTTARLRKEPVPTPSGDVWVRAVNFGDEVKVNIFRKDSGGQDSSGTALTSRTDQGQSGQPGQPLYDEKALAALDNVFRCKRTGEVRAVDPRLYQTLSVIYEHFGGKRVDLISGFRFQRHEASRHFHASAMDIRIPGVSLRELRDFADSLDPGGMGIGIYPRAGFVHIDWRAPGEPSYRWTDRAPARDGGGKRPSKRWKHRPNS